MSNNATKTVVPVDQRGHAIRAAMGLPIKTDTLYLGSDTDWAIFMDLSASKYERRAFTGMSAINPSASSEILLASVEDLMDTPTEFFRVGTQQFLTLDRLLFGPGMQDDSEGNRTRYILARLSLAQGTLSSGTIDYSGSGQPADQNTIVVNGIVYEFSSDMSKAPGNNFLVEIGATADDSYNNLATELNATQRYVSASNNPGTDILTLTANIGGTSGDAITIADGGTGAVFSGANLAGGAGGVLPTFHIW